MKIDLRKAVAISSVLAVLLVFSFVIYGAKSRQGSGNVKNEVSQAPVSQDAETPAVQAEEPAPAAETAVAEAAGDTSTQEASEPEAVEAPVSTSTAPVKQAAQTTTVKKPAITVASRGSTTVKPAVTSTAVKSTAAVKPSSKGGLIVETAKQYLGRPYVYGAAGPSSFDCSGLTMYVFGEVGISIPRTSKAQSQAGQFVPRDQLQPGDLVFFATDGTGSISHVGIYAGGGQFIEAPRTGETVRYSSMSSSYYSSRYVTARRLY